MRVRLHTAGESHGPALSAILEGIPARLALSANQIDADLARRQQGAGSGARMKLEGDRVYILGGVMEGMTTGAPIAMLIENRDYTHWKGKGILPFTIPRPGHADLTGAVKFGHSDLRPVLERASARETAARVAGGAVCRALLNEFGIRVEGYVSSIGGVTAHLDQTPLEDRAGLARGNPVHCPDPDAAVRMEAAISEATMQRQTLGGIIEVLAFGLPPGLGSYTQWDERLDGLLGGAILSIPAVKGVEFGPAFENSSLPGTEVQDPILLDGEKLVRSGLRSGGLEGGMTTGQPIHIRAAFKPIPTTLAPQHSVDLATGEAVETKYERSDFCPVPRAVVVLEAMTALVLAGALLEKLGGDSVAEMHSRFLTLRQARLPDLEMDRHEHTYWPGEGER